MPLKPGDIVMLNQNYNSYSHKGDIGYVTEVELKDTKDPRMKDDLVTIIQPLRPVHCTILFAYRLEKIGEAECQ